MEGGCKYVWCKQHKKAGPPIVAISRQSGGFERSGAPEICGDSPHKKWRFWKPGGRRQITAILGKKVAILSQNLAIFRKVFTGKTFISIELK